MLYNEGTYNWENIIMKRYSLYDIFKHYIGDFRIGIPFNSPLRKDENPSFAIFSTLGGDLMFKDFATGETGGWVRFIQLKFGMTYREAVIKCLLDLIISNLSPSDDKVIPSIHYTKKNVSIGLKLASIRDADLEYWKQFNIDESLLNKYNVVCVSTVWVNDNIVINRKNGELVYAYLINNKIKVYSPYAEKTKKWLGNTDTSCIYGLEQLPPSGELLIISKALKDVMTLRSLGYNAICGNAETSLIKESILKELEKRFKRIVVFLDNDEAGVNTALKYTSKYGYEHVYLLYAEKDISDHCKEKGIEKTQAILKHLLKS